MAAVEHTTVGTYRRPLAASLERVFENVLDWEHLPHLHASSFSSIDCLDAGPWGWRAEVGLQPAGAVILLEVLLEPDARRWVSRTLDGPGAGNEIWTVATATGERTAVVDVDFLVAGVRPDAAASLGRSYVALYAQLYDEDESMMVGRQRYLDRSFAGEVRCPHRGGPLGEPCDGVRTCPWHGYRFDVATGACLDDERLRLAVPGV
jgi:hypothetical protein